MRTTTMNVRNQINARAAQLSATNRIDININNDSPKTKEYQSFDEDELMASMSRRFKRERGLTTYDDDD